MLALLLVLRSVHHLSPPSPLRVYICFIRPFFAYSSIVWSGISQSCSRKLETVQQKSLGQLWFPSISLYKPSKPLPCKNFHQLLINPVPDNLINFCSLPLSPNSQVAHFILLPVFNYLNLTLTDIPYHYLAVSA